MLVILFIAIVVITVDSGGADKFSVSGAGHGVHAVSPTHARHNAATGNRLRHTRRVLVPTRHPDA